ncbi:D-alanyl-D-alanine endopeptidase [Pseudomaricurvus sp.]|uniref:D-alanyl-D-alanine endopeptidase n=1 Tax=Pseudomaricurvus sp. TaxID=2004510 RepID=UPI003F6D4A20
MRIGYWLGVFALGVGLWTGSLAAEDGVNRLDPARLQLASMSGLVLDAENGKELYSSHADLVLPIASITKLMTAMVVLDSKQPLNELLSVEIADNPSMVNVFSRVRIGSMISRKRMIQLALMSSENRIASSLGYHHPGGMIAFVAAMNAKAVSLGMERTRFVEPTGLSSDNVSTARDLGKLLLAARDYPVLTELSTAPKKDAFFRKPRYPLAFYNTNPLVRKSHWDIQLTKTGYLDDAGHCLVMLAKFQGQPLGLVFLDAFGKLSHIGDAGRVRRWVETGVGGPVPKAALRSKDAKLLALEE